MNRNDTIHQNIDLSEQAENIRSHEHEHEHKQQRTHSFHYFSWN